MRVQDVEQFWRWAAVQPDQAEVSRAVDLHYYGVLSAIADGKADPDPVALARSAVSGADGYTPLDSEKRQRPEVRYVRSSDEVSSGDEIS